MLKIFSQQRASSYSTDKSFRLIGCKILLCAAPQLLSYNIHGSSWSSSSSSSSNRSIIIISSSSISIIIIISSSSISSNSSSRVTAESPVLQQWRELRQSLSFNLSPLNKYRGIRRADRVLALGIVRPSGRSVAHKVQQSASSPQSASPPGALRQHIIHNELLRSSCIYVTDLKHW